MPRVALSLSVALVLGLLLWVKNNTFRPTAPTPGGRLEHFLEAISKGDWRSNSMHVINRLVPDTITRSGFALHTIPALICIDVWINSPVIML